MAKRMGGQHYRAWPSLAIPFVTPGVARPRQVDHSEKVDIYACAVILLELLLTPFGTPGDAACEREPQYLGDVSLQFRCLCRHHGAHFSGQISG